MPERHADWLAQARLDLDHARLAAGGHENGRRRGRKPYADADLLVVVDDTDLAPRDRSPRYRPSGLPVPADLTVCTRAELERELAAGNRFLTRILRESIPLYSRS
jgi:hypothetical protein